MKALKSNLIVKEFIIVNSLCEFIPFEGNTNTSEAYEVLSDYQIDIDYHISEQDSNYYIQTQVTINPEKKSGYSICVEGIGLFSFENPVEDPTERANFLYYSAVSICITNLRSYIANMTSYFPIGKFNFHSIDMNQLVKEKIEKESSEN